RRQGGELHRLGLLENFVRNVSRAVPFRFLFFRFAGVVGFFGIARLGLAVALVRAFRIRISTFGFFDLAFRQQPNLDCFDQVAGARIRENRPSGKSRLFDWVIPVAGVHRLGSVGLRRGLAVLWN